MAATGEIEEGKISLKILVHKERNKVVFAEADYKFVDALFSFMTLPMGTIVRLLGKQSGSQKPLGSLNSLYQSVESLPSSYFSSEECKFMLLHPRNSSEVYCTKLELNVDNTGPTKYFLCEDLVCSWRMTGNAYVSYYNTSWCKHCGKLMNREIGFKDLDIYISQSKGCVFVTESVSFLLTDDLVVMPNFPSSSFQILDQLGIKEMGCLEERTVTVGMEDILQLLKLGFCSTSPLTHLFLAVSKTIMSPTKYLRQPSTGKENPANATWMTLEVAAQKSNGKILFAQACEEFIDFLFNFLTIPLGLVACLLNGSTSLHAIDNLYRSISNLDADKYVKSQCLKDMLLNPQVAHQHLCENIMPVEEKTPPSCLLKGGKHPYYLTWYCQERNVKRCTCTSLEFIDPKGNVGFVRRPSMLMVTDDLVVKPLSSMASLDYLQQLNVPLSDVEVQKISIGMDEALGILKASLNSSSVFSDGLKFLLKKPKQEKI